MATSIEGIYAGCGSALDAAKVMWVYYEYPDTEFQDLVEFKSIQESLLQKM